MSVKQEMINECINLVRNSNRSLNEIRSSETESPEHKAIKERICAELLEQGHSFMTEAIFVTGGRADILVLDQFKIIEIAVSETEESLKEKALLYPPGLDIEVVRC